MAEAQGSRQGYLREGVVASDELVAGLNRQIEHEISASVQYLVLASFFERRSRTTLARLCYQRAEMKRDNALGFIGHLVDLDRNVEVGSIAAPQCEFASPAAALQCALDLELREVEQIRALIGLATDRGDHSTQQLLSGYSPDSPDEYPR